MSSTLTSGPAVVSALGVEEGGRMWARGRTWWPYPVVAILSVVIVVFVMQLWRADLRLPFTYHGEALYNGVLVKGLLERGWHLGNPALGAPGGLDLREVPMSDNNLHFALMWPLRLATSNYARAMNAYFLLTFPLIGLTALHVFRQFGLAAWPAVCGSLLFTFLPFHFSRGESHLFLAAYFLVPLAVMVALWIMSGAISLDDDRGRWTWRACRPQMIASAIICGLLGSGGVYYAFFACFFFLVAGTVVALRRRRLRDLLLPVALVALTTVVLTAQYLPSIVYLARHGETAAVRRNPVDAETYGLKISQLLLPATGHPLGPVARFKDAVNSEHGTNEGDSASLGLIGSLGFLALVGGFLLAPLRATRRDEAAAYRTWRDVSILNLSAVLLGTIGGFGALVALLVTSKIRAYNRISIYVAFFSLFAIVMGADHVYRRYCRDGGRRMAFAIGLAVLLVLGVRDQTGHAIPDYATIAFDYGNDGDFMGRLEAAMPKGAMIFQLPVIAFPENPSVHRMHDYDHARGYLRTQHVRWSYGAVRGRDDEVWQRWMADKPPADMIDTLAAAGFSGLYLNREGYRDGADRLSAEIERLLLGQAPVRSEHGRFLFFDLTEHRQRLRDRHSPEAWQAMQEAARHPLLVNWQDGCWEVETDPAGRPFRWCASAGAWRVINGAREPKRVTFEMTFRSAHPGELSIEGPLLSTRVGVDTVGNRVTHTLTIPPGVHVFDFRCTAPRFLAVRDARELVFRVVDFRVVPAAP